MSYNNTPKQGANMPQGKKVSNEVREKVVAALKSGKSALKVVSEFSVSTGYVYRIKNELNNKGEKLNIRTQKPKAQKPKSKAVSASKKAPNVTKVSKKTVLVESKAVKAIRSEISARKSDISNYEKSIVSKRNEIKALEHTLNIISK